MRNVVKKIFKSVLVAFVGFILLNVILFGMQILLQLSFLTFTQMNEIVFEYLHFTLFLSFCLGILYFVFKITEANVKEYFARFLCEEQDLSRELKEWNEELLRSIEEYENN